MPEPELSAAARRVAAADRVAAAGSDDPLGRWEIVFKAGSGGVPPLTAVANFALALCLEYAPVEQDTHDGQDPDFNRPLVMLLSLLLYGAAYAENVRDINKVRITTARELLKVDAAAGMLAAWRPRARTTYAHPDFRPRDECGTVPVQDAAELQAILNDPTRWTQLRDEALRVVTAFCEFEPDDQIGPLYGLARNHRIRREWLDKPRNRVTVAPDEDPLEAL